MSETQGKSTGAPSLRVLFCSRSTLFSGPGGDTIQILKTAELLRALGCEVEISVEPDPSLEGFDILHIVNLTRPQSLVSVLKAKQLGIPVALSTIYVDYREADRLTRRPLQRLVFRMLPGSSGEFLKMAARAAVNREMNQGTLLVLRKGFRRAQRLLIENSSVLLPNSESEMRRMERDFPETRGRSYMVVPNAVDHRVFDPARTAPIPELQDCVLSVGRIERRKCQLDLVRAVKGTGLKLVVLGNPGPNQIAYYDQIKREADSNVIFIPHVPYEELPRYYASCKVHALVSWMETTGLSSLEAGVMGANLVITDKGDTREYFADFVEYCDPGSVSSIRDALLAAHRRPKSSDLRHRILERYTWDETARCTLTAYRSLLQNRPNPLSARDSSR